MGYMHETGKIERIGSRIKLETTNWETKKGDVRLVGPKLTSFPANTEWRIGKTITRLDKLTIKKSTKARQLLKMIPPPSEISWPKRLY